VEASTNQLGASPSSFGGSVAKLIRDPSALMSKESNLKRVIKGAVAGAVAGIVASWAANQFHSLWSHLAGEEQNPEVARLSDRGGRPDTAAAKEKVASGEPPQEDATVTIASKVSKAVFDHPLTMQGKHQAGVGVHYAFGAATSALYGAVAELVPVTKIGQGSGFGLSVWLAGVEVAIPLLGLSKPPWGYPSRMHAYSFISHLIYGTVTEQVRRCVRSIL
jgi:putative membrane protein